jgi:hypothetical protein
VSDLYIPRIGLPIYLQQNRQTNSPLPPAFGLIYEGAIGQL